jgi:hypothetical protein
VKWLSEIEAVERPFDGFLQVDRYVYEWTRNGQQVTEPVTLQRVRALITEPAHEQELESGDLTIRGVAWSGAAPIAPSRRQRGQRALASGAPARHAAAPQLAVVGTGRRPGRIRPAHDSGTGHRPGRPHPARRPRMEPPRYGSNAIQQVRVHSA